MNRNDVITALTGCLDCTRSLKSPIVHISFPMAAEILELLKEQEARILSWDEIKKYPVVFGEFKGVEKIFPLIITVDSFFDRCLAWNPGINVSDEYFLLVNDEEDRKNTRCWNIMPTDEQRQKEKWYGE